jgi:hypothetical protein
MGAGAGALAVLLLVGGLLVWLVRRLLLHRTSCGKCCRWNGSIKNDRLPTTVSPHESPLLLDYSNVVKSSSVEELNQK